MGDFLQSLWTAGGLFSGADPRVWSIMQLSVTVSGVATLLASALALPVAAWLALTSFPGRGAVLAALNALMGLPSVVVGLLVYLLLSRAGPLGSAGILFSPPAMVIAQTLLVMPLIAALARQTLEDALTEYGPYLASLNAGKAASMGTLLFEARFSLATAVLAGFARAAAEVGAVLIVGGNIDGVTRVMTTAIALETSKGDLPLALGLGLLLMTMVLAVNVAAHGIHVYALRRHG
ncbi:MAG TPA: ABC transporter permease [Burkholderiaceae bacterium]|jgi:tungstate transport system permease protein|nr:ABC transporter permease [Burkholderiaceae bacterium]